MGDGDVRQLLGVGVTVSALRQFGIWKRACALYLFVPVELTGQIRISTLDLVRLFSRVPFLTMKTPVICFTQLRMETL